MVESAHVSVVGGDYKPSWTCPDANLKDGMEKYSTPVESTSVAGIMEVIWDQLG